jgi:hypothetical protein
MTLWDLPAPSAVKKAQQLSQHNTARLAVQVRDDATPFSACSDYSIAPDIKSPNGSVAEHLSCNPRIKTLQQKVPGSIPGWGISLCTSHAPPSTQMLAEEPLMASLDASLASLIAGFGVDSAKVRASVMKGLTEVAAAEPSVLTSSRRVLSAVGALLRDPAKLVRAAALELVGEHVCARPAALLPRYTPLLLEKLADEGTATRKKAVGIVRNLLLRRQFEAVDAAAASTAGLREPEGLLPRAGYEAAVLRALLARASDRNEEDSVKEAISATFAALWFGPPGTDARSRPVGEADLAAADDAPVVISSRAGTTAVRASANASVHARSAVEAPVAVRIAADLRSRAAQIVGLVDAGLGAGQDAKWLSTMLGSLVETEEGAAAGARAARKRVKTSAGEAGKWSPRDVLAALMGVMVDGLSSIASRKVALTASLAEEGEEASGARDAASSSPRTSASVEKADSPKAVYARELVAVVAALATCAAALPSALGTHVRLLAPLLRDDPLLSASANATLQAHVADVLELTLASARDTPPLVLNAVETDLLALVREGSSPALQQAAAAALGVLVTVVTGDDTRVRSLLANLLGSVSRLRARFTEAARERAARAGAAPPTPEQEAVVWLRELLSAARAPGSSLSLPSALRALQGAGLLAKYCDLDRTGAAGRAVLPSVVPYAPAVSAPAAEEEETEEDGATDEESKAPAAAAEESAEEEESEFTDWSSGSKASKGRKTVSTYGKKGGAAGKRPATASASKAPSSKSRGKGAPKPAPASTVSALDAAVPRGGTVSRVYEQLFGYAHAALKLSGAARSAILTSAARITAAGAGLSTSESTARRQAVTSAQSQLHDVTAVGAAAARALSFTFTRAPALALREEGREYVRACLASPLAAIKAEGLGILVEMLGSQDERHAVARVIAARAAQDARTVAALRASGSEPSDALLASATGSLLSSAILSTSSTLGGGEGLVEGGGVQVTKADGTVLKGKAHILGGGASDTTAQLLTSIVQEHWEGARSALAYSPSPAEVDLGLQDVASGEGVRARAGALLGLVVRQGVRGPDDTVPLLMAQSCDERSIADGAHSHLIHLAEAYPGQVERHTLAGMVASYTFQLDVFGTADPREPVEQPEREEEREEEEEEESGPLGAPVLGRFWSTCIAHNPTQDAGAPPNRGRLALLRSLVSRIVPDTIPGLHAASVPAAGGGAGGLLASLGLTGATAGLKRMAAFAERSEGSGPRDAPPNVLLSRYLCATLAVLPLEREEDVLTLAAYINRVAAVHADSIIASLSRYVPAGSEGGGEGGAALPPPGSPAYTSLATQAALAHNLSCLLRVKRHLKEAHKLADSKVAAFDPTAPAALRSADKTLEGVHTVATTDAELPALPTAFARAVACAGERPPAKPAAGVAPPSSPPRALLSPTMLAYVVASLEETLAETGGDFPEALCTGAFIRRKAAAGAKRKGGPGKKGEEGAGGTVEAAGAAASGSAKRGGRPGAKKRKRLADSDGEDEEEGEAGGPAPASAAPVRKSGRAVRARAVANYADEEAMDGE